jgi:molybdopterin-guanine dinucleotide biosynthesis protein A
MSDDSVNGLLVMLGKAQVDAVFCRQADYPVDDSEFLPLVEAVLTGFEMAGIDEEVVEAVWEHAFYVYDQACKEAVPESTTADNRRLMQSYLLGKRRKAGR